MSLLRGLMDEIAAAQAAEEQLDWQEAADAWARAGAASPHDHRLPMHRAQALWLADEPLGALEACEQALGLQPTAAPAHCLLAHILRDLNRFEAAETVYAQAMELEGPDHGGLAAWSRSQVLLGLERYDEAFAMAEGRFALARLKPWRPGPWWQGWPATGSACDPRELVVWSEQGLGDSLQYVRWIPELVRRGHRVRLELEPVLVPLLRRGLAWLGETLTVAPRGLRPRPLPKPCQGSLLSLPALLGGGPLPGAFAPGDTASAQGYLRFPTWRQPRQAPLPPGSPPSGALRIGLVWASGHKRQDGFIAREYERRSLPAADLIHLLEGLQQSWQGSGRAAAGLELINLQFGSDRRRADGWSGRFREEMAEDAGLVANAELMGTLDLLITVDTASAHLAGALGLPAWVLLPWGADPRWLRGREDSPWYPSLTLLRQPAHRDWPGLVTLVLDRFRDWLGPPPEH